MRTGTNHGSSDNYQRQPLIRTLTYFREKKNFREKNKVFYRFEI